MDETSPSRIVRTNWLRFSWNQISNANKILLVVASSISLLQIIITCIVLGIGSHLQLSCEKPLQMYLIIFVIRIGISLPFSVYQHLTTPTNSTQRNRQRVQDNTINEPTYQPQPQPQTQQQQQPQEQPSQPSQPSQHPHTHTQQRNLSSGWANRVKSVLDLFAILWFIVGNYLLFSPSECSATARLYYYTILAWIIFGYLILIIPILICASIIFCLPCVLVAMRTFNINISNVMVGGSKEEIAKIPVLKYKSTPTEEQGYLTIPKSEDAICSICLSEYEDNELICKLWCNHHFHKDCVHEWLGLNSSCPLCKRDFRGKNYTSDEEQDV